MPYVPIKEAARLLSVSEDTIHRRLKAGKLQGAQQERPGGWMWMVEIGQSGAPEMPSSSSSETSIDTTTTELATSAARSSQLETEVRLLREQISQLQGQLQLQTLVALEALSLAKTASTASPTPTALPPPSRLSVKQRLRRLVAAIRGGSR